MMMSKLGFIPLDQAKINDLLTPEINNRISDAENGAIEIFDSVDSTSDYLRKKITTEHQVNICITEAQTQGRGRLGRQWHSPYGENVYFSLAYPLQKKLTELSGLSLLFGLVICKAIEACYQLPYKCLVKWPNDIKINEKKIAGNLVELKTHSVDHCHAIMGVGINVNMDIADQKQIDQPWTSIKKLSGKIYDRNMLCAKLIEYLILSLQRFEQFGFQEFLSEWQERDCLLGQEIKMKQSDITYTGIGVGVNRLGHLVLKLEDGNEKAFISGEADLIKKN